MLRVVTILTDFPWTGGIFFEGDRRSPCYRWCYGRCRLHCALHSSDGDCSPLHSASLQFVREQGGPRGETFSSTPRNDVGYDTIRYDTMRYDTRDGVCLGRDDATPPSWQEEEEEQNTVPSGCSHTQYLTCSPPLPRRLWAHCPPWQWIWMDVSEFVSRLSFHLVRRQLKTS